MTIALPTTISDGDLDHNGHHEIIHEALNTGVVNQGIFEGPHPWIDVTHPTYGATGDGVTDDAAAIQAAVNEAMTYAQGQRPAVFLPPGTYAIASTVDLKGVSLLGSGRTIATKILWIGGGGGTMLKSGNGDVGNSYKQIAGIQIIGGTVGAAGEAAVLLDLSDAYIDLGFRLFDVQFAGGTTAGIKADLGWVMAHLGPDLRFDNVGGYAIDLKVASGANRQPFTIEHVYYDHNRGAGQSPGSGFMRIDNSVVNAPDVGVVNLRSVRVDVSQAWTGTHKAIVDCKLNAAPAGPPGIILDFSRCAYVDIAAQAGDSLIYHDTASTTSRGVSVVVSDCQFGGLANYISGNWPANVPKPPLNTDVALYSEGLIVRGPRDTYLTDPVSATGFWDRYYFAQEANPRLAVAIRSTGPGPVELQAGPGGATALDTRLIGRGGVGFSYVPCLVKAGVPADSDFQDNNPPNGVFGIDSNTDFLYYRKAGVWTKIVV